MRWKPPEECGIDNRPENYRKNRSVINVGVSSNGNILLSSDEYNWLVDKEHDYCINYYIERFDGQKKSQDFKYDNWICSIEMPKKLAVEFFMRFG